MASLKPQSLKYLQIKSRTFQKIETLHEKDNRVKCTSFSRNFGKESAILAGLEKATGDFTVLMDADLQDPPAILPEMYQYIEEGYDSVATRRVDRKGEPPIRSFFARRFTCGGLKLSEIDSENHRVSFFVTTFSLCLEKYDHRLLRKITSS